MRALFFHVDGKLPSYSGMRMAHHFRSLGWEFEIRRAGNVHAIEPRLDDSPHMQLAEATSAVIDRERAEHAITRDLLAVALRRGDGAAAARLERMEVVMRGVLAFHNKHEQAAWDKQQAWMAFEAALVEVEK